MKMATISKMADRVFRRINWRVAACYLCLVAVLAASFSCSDREPYKINRKFSGHVYDADTKEPIKGAQIWANWWHTFGVFGQTRTRSLTTVTAETDENGYYEFVAAVPMGTRINLDFILYKKGYIAYSNEGGFKYVYKNQKFKRKKNEIYLRKWDLGEERKIHREHIFFMIIAYGCRHVYDQPEKYEEKKNFCMEVYDELQKSLDR